MKCHHCEHEVSSFQAYCMNCGAKLERTKPAIETAAPQSPAAEPAAAPVAEPAAVAEQAPPAPRRDPFGEPGAAVQTAYQATAPVAAPAAAVDAETPPEHPRGRNTRDPFSPQPDERNDYSDRYYGEQPVSTGHWLGTMFLLLLVPFAIGVVSGVVGSFVGPYHIVTRIIGIIGTVSPLIMMLIWAFSRRSKPSKRNFFRALLIFYIIIIVLVIAASIVIALVFPQLITELTYLLESGGIY